MISKSLISTFLSKSEWIIRRIFFKTMSIPNYDEVTFRKLLSLRDKLCMPGILEPNKLNWPSYVRANLSTHIIFCESIHAFQHAFMRPFMRKVRLDLQERVI